MSDGRRIDEARGTPTFSTEDRVRRAFEKAGRGGPESGDPVGLVKRLPELHESWTSAPDGMGPADAEALRTGAA